MDVDEVGAKDRFFEYYRSIGVSERVTKIEWAKQKQKVPRG